MTTALVTGASSGIGDASKLPNVMKVEDLVDAALVGFDRKELGTIPPVPDVAGRL